MSPIDLRDRRFHNLLQLCLDLLSVKAIWVATIGVRILLNPLLNQHVRADNAGFWGPPIALALPLWLATSFRFRLYRAPDKITFWAIQLSAFENAFTLTMITAVVTFCSREFGELVSRLFVPVMLPIAFVALSLSRYLALWLTLMAQKRLETPRRTALVGSFAKSNQLLEKLGSSQTNSYWGLIVPEDDLARVSNPLIPLLGTTRQLAELINTERLDRVIILNASLPRTEFEYCSQVIRRMGMPVSCAVESAAHPVYMDVNTAYGLPFVELIPVQFTRQQEIVKRVFDVLLAAFLLVALSPLMLVIALLIKATSKGPVLYKAPRAGKGGRHFTFMKFRSMRVNSDRPAATVGNEKNGHIFKMKNDPRVTRVGRFIRRYSLDELPQLINILRGEMSFVGPRPLPASDLGPDGMSQTFSVWSEARARVQPGLTGLWQVSGRSDLLFEDMVRLDLSYVQNWSLALDIKIMLDTPLLVLRGAGAY
jgi:exopolysaccharide biosynthesis polyprenyl glycosylphosphotransferase